MLKDAIDIAKEFKKPWFFVLIVTSVLMFLIINYYKEHSLLEYKIIVAFLSGWFVMSIVAFFKLKPHLIKAYDIYWHVKDISPYCPKCKSELSPTFSGTNALKCTCGIGEICLRNGNELISLNDAKTKIKNYISKHKGISFIPFDAT